MAYSEYIKKSELDKCSYEELKNALITLDGLGKEAKKKVLDELLTRAFKKGLSTIQKND